MTTFPDITAPARPDTVTSSRVDWAPVPKVDLLPPEIVEARRLARLKRLLAGAVVVTVLACAGATVWARAGASAAQDELDAAQARGVTLRAQQAKYAAVPKVLGLIQDAGTAREHAMGQDVLWYGFLSDLAVTTPKGVTLNGLQVSLDHPTVAQDPLVQPGIGSVTFTGTARNFPEVAAWLDAVATVHGMQASTLQSATRGDSAATTPGSTPAASGATAPGTGVSFSSTVTVTSQALTHRYDRKAD